MKTILRGVSVFLAVLMLAGGSLAAGTELPSEKDDFYEAVNGAWIAAAVIPDDKVEVGGFMDLTDGIEDALMADFAAMLGGEKQPDNAELASFVELYRLAQDYETRNAAGAEPLLPYMERIENLESLEDFTGQWAAWDLQGMPSPFVVGVSADMGDASTNALYIAPPGLFLLDKSYYQDEATKAALQDAYRQMSTNLLVMAGKTQEEADEIVAQALAFDESLAPYTRSAEEASDVVKKYNPVAFAEFDAQVEGFDFAAAFQELLGTTPDTVITTTPEYFAAMDELVNAETFPAMKSWMLVSTVNGHAPYLDNDARVESGSFMRLLTGTAEAPTAEKEAFRLASNVFDEVVGIYYGNTYFGEEAKADVREMVETIIQTYENRLDNNTWLGEETRDKAIQKLEAMALNLGYPDEPRAVYSKMVTVPADQGGTLMDNLAAFVRVSKEDNYGKLGQPVDRGLWPLGASTVNAMYSPQDNSINFPAAILQAPFYSLEQSPSANYGGFGAVVAHEISHAFDPNGAKFDELGNLSDWWTAEDYATFEQLSQAMVEEFDGIPYAGGTVNGALTVTENVADAGGLSCALESVKMEDDADLEEFFTQWGIIWRQKARPEYEALLLTLDTHAPNKVRANTQLQNMDDFYTTFDIQEGDGMYRAQEDRVNIW